MSDFNFKDAADFLNVLDPIADFRSAIDGLKNGFTFQTFNDSNKQDTSLCKVTSGTFREVYKDLGKLNRMGAGVYVTVNETNGVGRKKTDIIRPRAIWIEDDNGANIPTPLQPHIITETSPNKFHKLFIVKGLTPASHQLLQDILVRDYGSDPNAKDLSRVLRIPGFYHTKDRRKPFLSRLLLASESRPYTLDEVLRAFNAVVPEAPIYVLNRKAPVPEEAEYVPITEADAFSDVLPDITLENCKLYLPAVTDLPYNKWRDVGMALHHQFSGSDEALAIFDNWSENMRGYKGSADVAHYWNSFGGGSGNPITFRYILKQYNALSPADRAINAEEHGKKLLADCVDYRDLLDSVAPKLKELSKDSRALQMDFVKLLIQRYAALRPGEKLNKGDAERAMRQPNRIRRATHVAGDEIPTDTLTRVPEWAANWCWVSCDERFYHHVKSIAFTESAFNAHYRRVAGFGNDDESIQNVAAFLRDNNMIPIVDQKQYVPWADTYFVNNENGSLCVNTYNPTTRMVVPDAVENANAAQLFKHHVSNVCGGWNREAILLCNFLRDCTAEKPIKIRWAPLIVGRVGDGKSFFYMFMRKAMGEPNVKTLTNSIITASATSGQSGWAEGGCFAFIEELKLHGHNRFDVANALKPYITNDVVTCRKLYAEVCNIANTQNYFAASNYPDCLPIEKGERRWFVLFNKMNVESMPENYFKALHDALDYAGDIVAWLRTVPNHADYQPDATAPETSEKGYMRALTSDDWNESIADVISNSTDPHVSPDVVSFHVLQTMVHYDPRGVDDNKGSLTTKLRNALLALGYVKLGRTNFNGISHVLWSKYAGTSTMTMVQAVQEMLESIRDMDDYSQYI